MPFRPVTSEKLSDAVVDQIETLILRGILRPGQRLPAERDLADRLGVSRPSLRDALGALQDQGLLTAKPGAGVYVSDALGSAFSPALSALFARHTEAVFDYLGFRRDMEGQAAERAAKLASDTDLKVVQTILDQMVTAHAKQSGGEETKLDAQFHMAIIEASHNVVMLHMMRSMYKLLEDGVFYNRQIMFKQRTTRATLLAQHQDINTALQARDPQAARAAVEAHLDFVQESLRLDQKTRAHEDVARQRLNQLTAQG
ncbi:MAG: FadR/GntR family transcriptional regulator [Pseudomonadota bacterium]